MIDLAARAWLHFDGLGWFLLLLAPLLLLQRALHRELQAVFYLLTRRADISLLLFSVLFLPGVFLHEASHYLAARLLQVRTGRFSIVPKPLNKGRLQLGFVETAETDFARDAAIGAAPLLSGGVVTALIADHQMNLAQLGETLTGGRLAEFFQGLAQLPQKPDFWLWFYLVFVISSMMFPSESDRRGWLPVLAVAVLLTVAAVLIGIGPWMVEHLSAGLNQAFRAAAGIWATSLGVHAVLLAPVWTLRKIVNRVTGLEIRSA